MTANKSAIFLTALSVVGIVGTVILTARQAPKATEALKKAEEESEEPLEPIEKAKVLAPFYIPVVAAGVATVTCVIGTNVLNKRSQAALASAYGLVSEGFKEYRKKLVELHGEEADKEVLEALARDNCQMHYTDIDCPDNKRLFYEPISKTIFSAYERSVMDAEYHFNRNFTMRGYATLNEFYDFLGIEWKTYGDALGWCVCDGYTWVDFEHRVTTLEDGTEVTVIDYIFEPDNSFIEEWGLN